VTDSQTLNQATSHLDTTICAVTVYTDQAMVTRRGVVALTGQERELAIAGLPTTIQPDSVRANGAGTVAVRLLGVRAERIYATEPVAERVAQVSQLVRDLEQQKSGIEDAVAALHLQRNFVQGLSEKSVDCFSQSFAQQSISLNETRQLLDFLGQQYSAYTTAIAQKETQKQELDNHLQALYQQLQQLQTPHSHESFTLIVAIAPTGAGEFKLEVSYMVDWSGWVPLYDLRVNTAGDRVYLSYLAEVQQNSGEDWLGMNLTLSTAKPGLGTLPPKLAPWYIDTQRPTAQPMRRRNQLGKDDAPIAMSASSDVEVTEVDSIKAQSATAAVSREGGIVSFQISGGSNIPSDGTPHKITIFNENYPSRTEYIAMPKLVSFAYLQATVSNRSDGAVLLPGKANIFRNNTFVGTNQLENIAPGQEFKLNLGIDEGLKIERNLVERQVDKRLLSNQRRIFYAYRLTITNLRDRLANLRLTEQLPVSRHEQIKVNLTRIDPQIETEEMGVLEWAIALPPQSRSEVYYQFSVEHPTDLTIVGLDI